MPELLRTTSLACPPGVAFDVSLDLDVELAVGERVGLRALPGGGGRTGGRIGLGETVTWQLRLGGLVPVRHTSRIVELERPTWFVDAMDSGLFAEFRHEHRFEAVAGGGCAMHDRMAWRSPLGPLGAVADAAFVRRVLAGLLDARNAEVARRCAPAGAA